ncbi:MAG TPA: ribosome-binding factor A [Isosphaeraceae bacterium]|jgi:ribosome-binding factor A|nr:ribosome-binding factor A [Isosphaeraceae bacterium]
MTMRRPRRKVLRSLCAEVHPDDGVDPRERARSSGRKKAPRKGRQLCKQVAETLDGVLAGEGDALLQSLRVVAVEPAPDLARLLVTVASALPGAAIDPAAVLDHLGRAAGHLRSEVAAAITRRKAPSLAFRVALADAR